jgi:hypothetical protein
VSQDSNMTHGSGPAALGLLKSFLARCSIVFLVGSFAGLIYALGSVVGPQWTQTIERVNSQYVVVAESRADFSEAFVQVHQGFAISTVLPTSIEISRMSDDVRGTLDALSRIEAPTLRIDRNRGAYRRSIDSLLGAINVYDGSPDQYQILLNAFQTEANRGGDLLDAVEAYTAGGFRSLWGTVF